MMFVKKKNIYIYISGDTVVSDASFEPGNIEQRTVGDTHTKSEPRTCEHDVSATFVQ